MRLSLLCALALGGLASTAPLLAQRATQVAPQVYFKQDWCPEASELVELERFARVDLNGCCVRRLIPLDNMGMPAGSLTALRARVVDTMDDAECTGSNSDTRAQRELEIQTTRKEAAELLRTLPDELRKASQTTICAMAGKAIRGEIPMPSIILAEVKRRRLSINASAAHAGQFRIGESECQLFAAKGLPETSSRTVTRRGVWVRHAYDGLTVHTTNGFIESWQD